MNARRPPSRVPPPRAAVGDKALDRPDWTVSHRNTEGVIALDKNETTDPIFREQLAEIVAALPPRSVFEYPECAPYYSVLAEHLGVSPANLLFTAGADGGIRAVFEAFLSPGETVILTTPTFAMFPIYARMYAGRVVELPYRPSDAGPRLDADEVLESIGRHQPRLIFLSNPDSPTGTIFKADAVRRIIETAAEAGAVILIDEAYYPFSGVTCLDMIDDFPNLVVTRTFAKAWGLAGLRLGFAAAHPDMARILHKVRPMYEVNGFALAAMAALIKREDAVIASVRRINEGKNYFLGRMRQRGLRAADCAGNFLLVDFGDKRQAVHAALQGKVLYKPSFPDACLAGFSRFTTAPKAVMAELSDIIEGALR